MLKNVKDIFCDCLLHVKIWKRNKLLGYMHSSIAFGWFMLIVISWPRPRAPWKGPCSSS